MKRLLDIPRERIQQLFDRYLELVRLEVEEFGVRPTEVRHLIGRLGEFFCALYVNGALSHRANQQGFDVVCANKRCVSVKSTAQINGFVGIRKSTLAKVDDLMLVQYRDSQVALIYYGPIADVIPSCRTYDYSSYYELDIAKAREIMRKKTLQAP